MCRHFRHTLLLLFPLVCGAQTPPGEPVLGPSELSIRVIEGDGAINSIKLKRGHDPVVQVTDRTGEPVTGAVVTFILPAFGASGEFSDGGRSLTVQSGAKGIATAHGLRPNRTPGKFTIRVTASLHGQAASAELTQTNAEPVASANHGKTIAILAIIAGAAAGGVIAATHGGKSGTPSTAGSSAAAIGSIVAGQPTLGPPQ
ncbi:MAG TPA: hypothetical protein VG675_08575 [Bryobacteraceae bacterium]|nr:hypothetical protein [Bryobacteraceae bacterium]